MEKYEKATMEIVDIKDDVILTSLDCKIDCPSDCEYEMPIITR